MSNKPIFQHSMMNYTANVNLQQRFIQWISPGKSYETGTNCSCRSAHCCCNPPPPSTYNYRLFVVPASSLLHTYVPAVIADYGRERKNVHIRLYLRVPFNVRIQSPVERGGGCSRTPPPLPPPNSQESSLCQTFIV